MKEVEHVFPVTIIDDRFGGLYSGGAYLAFNLEPWDVPKVFSWGGDIDCADFWGEESSRYLIGKGDTPAEAYNDLIRLKMIENLHLFKGMP